MEEARHQSPILNRKNFLKKKRRTSFKLAQEVPNKIELYQDGHEYFGGDRLNKRISPGARVVWGKKLLFSEFSSFSFASKTRIHTDWKRFTRVQTTHKSQFKEKIASRKLHWRQKKFLNKVNFLAWWDLSSSLCPIRKEQDQKGVPKVTI